MMTISGNTSRTPTQSRTPSPALSIRSLSPCLDKEIEGSSLLENISTSLFQEQSPVQQTSPTNSSDPVQKFNLDAMNRAFEAEINDSNRLECNFIYSINNTLRTSSPTNNPDTEHHENLQKAYIFGTGFGKNNPDASKEILKQGFQSFMQKIPQPDTPTQAGYSVGKHSIQESAQESLESVAQKTTTQSKIPLNDRLEAYSPGADTQNIHRIVRNNFKDYKDRKYNKKKIIETLQTGLSLEALNNLMKIFNNKKSNRVSVDEDYRKQCIQEAIDTHPKNQNTVATIEIESKPAAKKRKHES
jgi:hypothetical protein